MSILESIILGFIQGVTEFLPNSSSGHIEIGKVLLNVNLNDKKSLFLTLILHLATAFSTIIVYRKKVYKIFSDLFKFEKNPGFTLSIKIIISIIIYYLNIYINKNLLVYFFKPVYLKTIK